MIRGIYTATTGMLTELERQNSVTNNLANVDTIGYKRDSVSQVPFNEVLIKAMDQTGSRTIGPFGFGVESINHYTDFSNGNTMATENQFDFALEGLGLFAVQAQEELKYTRAGNFVLDRDGYLTTKAGYRVLGQNGPIRLGQGAFAVSPQGEIFQGEKLVDRFQLAAPEQMVKEGENLYRTSSGEPAVPATNCLVHQGMIEKANVSVVREMVKMITVFRTYEACQKTLTAQDETLSKTINELAK